MTFAQPFAEYEILDRVGAGAMGTVFKARHKRLNRIVALKVLKPSLARDSRYVDRLKREARIVASLNHPNIVTGFDLGEEAGYHYFVMEFVEGKSLRAMLTEWGMFGEPYVRKVARQVAQALDHAFQRGVIHRDIKPGNILIDEAGNVKLTDMGLAKGPADLTITRDGATVGTPQYISPEQARNPHDVDVRTDLYSLGATLYHMATGVPPFRGDTMAELITNVLHELPVSPRAINSALSEGMSLVIRKLLAKDLTVRYQTPHDLLDDLDRLDKSMPPQIDAARLSAEEGELVRWWPRALLVLGAAALLGGAVWVGLQMRDPGASAPTASEFVEEMQAKLATLPTYRDRLVCLAAVDAPPVGSLPALQQLQRAVQGELQQALDAVVDGFTGQGFEALVAWAKTPAQWPDRNRVVREQVQPKLVAATGFGIEALPKVLHRERLEELLVAIDQALADRDRELRERFERHLQTKVAPAAEQSIRGDDFAHAGRLWSGALDSFCNGLDVPRREQLPEALAQQLRDLHALRLRAAEERILPVETQLAQAFIEDVKAACMHLADELAQGFAPATAAERLLALRQELPQRWPPSSSFRIERNPWPTVERQLADLQLKVDIAADQLADRRFDGRCSLAWRTLLRGRAADALAVLQATTPAGGTRAAKLQRHREALQAAAAVEQAVIQAIVRQNQSGLGLVGFLRGVGDAVDVRAEPIGDSWRLTCTALSSSQQPVRSLHLSELRFAKLLAQLPKDRSPFAGLSDADRTLGVAIWRLVADDVDGLDAVLESLSAEQREFVVDEVWPRVLPVRNEQPDAPLDRRQLFADLRRSREAVPQGGMAALQRLWDKCDKLVPEHERSDEEAAELRAGQKVLQFARRIDGLAGDLRRVAPRGAGIDVRLEGDDLVASVELPAATLQADARDGWQFRDGRLEFFGGGGPWSEAAKHELRCSAGFEPTATHLRAELDLVLPPAAIGTRFWVFEFRGVACVLVVTADDVAHAAMVEGDVRDEANVQAAFVRAITEVTAPSRETRPVIVPGAVHRLTIELTATSQRTSARMRVWFEGIELMSERKLQMDPERLPTFAVHARQEIAVQRLLLRAIGL